MRRALLSFTVLGFLFLCGYGRAELSGKMGKIQGESFVNLRSGPDLSHPPRAVLKEGEEVIVEAEEGSWYLVSLADGRRGYVHKTLVRLSGRVESKKVVREEKAPEPGEVRKKDLQDLHPQTVKRETPKGKPLPIIKVLEGREWEILWWLGVALCLFVLGWICGGNYYLRRDRINKTRLRF